MTRQRMLFLISVLTILVGVGWIWSFLSPLINPNKPKVLNPVLVIMGVVFLLVGWGLFRRNEVALEFGFWSWFTSLIWNVISAVFLIGEISNQGNSRNMISVIFIAMLLAVQLFVVIFLGQKKTKQLFISDSAISAEGKGE